METILNDRKSLTGKYLSGERVIGIPRERRPPSGKFLSVRGARQNNLKNVNVEIPLEQFVCVTGASGSGKSSLIHDIVQKQLYSLLHDSRVLAGDHDELTGHQHISDVIDIDQSPIGRSSRSNPATYIGFYDDIRKLFADTKEARQRRFTPSTFSFNVKGGRCEECSGEGTITTQLSFMPDVEVTCPTCKGARYDQETLEVKYHGKSIAEVLDMSIEDGVEFFHDQPGMARKIGVLDELGLGYLKLGHPSTILSGGEAQRIKLAAELGKLKRGKHNLYIFDEPTTGLHFADIDRLLESLNRLVDTGHSVVVIEHNLDVIKTADYVIDPRPGRWPQGRRTDCLRHSRSDFCLQEVAHWQVSGGPYDPMTGGSLFSARHAAVSARRYIDRRLTDRLRVRCDGVHAASSLGGCSAPTSTNGCRPKSSA